MQFKEVAAGRHVQWYDVDVRVNDRGEFRGRLEKYPYAGNILDAIFYSSENNSLHNCMIALGEISIGFDSLWAECDNMSSTLNR